MNHLLKYEDFVNEFFSMRDVTHTDEDGQFMWVSSKAAGKLLNAKKDSDVKMLLGMEYDEILEKIEKEIVPKSKSKKSGYPIKLLSKSDLKKVEPELLSNLSVEKFTLYEYTPNRLKFVLSNTEGSDFGHLENSFYYLLDDEIKWELALNLNLN